MADVDTSVLERLQATVKADPLNPIFAEALRCEAIKVIRQMQFALADYVNKRYDYLVEEQGRPYADDLYYDRNTGPTGNGGNGAQPRRGVQASASAPAREGQQWTESSSTAG